MKISGALATLLAAAAFLRIEVGLVLEVGKWIEGRVLGWSTVLAGAYTFAVFFLLGYLAGKGSRDA